MRLSPREQILEFLDSPLREDKYHRTELDHMQLGDVSTDQLQHYLACRRQLEEHLDEESVFDELCRLAMQSDEETSDWFDRITKVLPIGSTFAAAEAMSLSTNVDIPQDRLARIAAGMLSDGWAEHEVRYALETLRGSNA